MAFSSSFSSVAPLASFSYKPPAPRKELKKTRLESGDQTGRSQRGVKGESGAGVSGNLMQPQVKVALCVVASRGNPRSIGGKGHVHPITRFSQSGQQLAGTVPPFQTALAAAPREIGQDPIARSGVLRMPVMPGASGNVRPERHRFPRQGASTSVEALCHQGCVLAEKQQVAVRIERHGPCWDQTLVLARLCRSVQARHQDTVLGPVGILQLQ